MSSFVHRRSVLRLATGAAALALAGPGLAVMASGQAMAEQDPAAQVVQRAADQVIAALGASNQAALSTAISNLNSAKATLGQGASAVSAARC